MKNNNKIIALQACILLCTFALPFISLYCQEKPRQLKKAPLRRRRLSEIKKSQATPTTQPEVKKTDEPTQETPETTEIEAITQTEEPQQTQTALIPRTSTSWHNKFTPLLLAMIYQGSETGIAAFTKAMIKLFTTRKTTLEALEKEKKAQEKLISQEPIKDQLFLKQKLEKEVQQIQQSVSLPTILQASLYMGMLNTAVPIMGLLMGSAVKVALQMLMPAQPS
jgi:hypothetical protein